MEKITIEEIKKRVKKSFVSLLARQVLLRIIGFVTINIILAKILPVETLGIFNIATGIITFFAFFSDVGLAASLIQKKEVIKKEDISTTFTIQICIVGILSLAIFLAAPYFGKLYNLNIDGVWLIRVLGISFFLTSLKVIPSVLLERNLRFNPLVFVEVIETLIFNILLIYLVYQGKGLWSFSVAALVKAIIGVVIIYAVAPVRVGLGIEKAAARKLLSFGLPFQANNLLALVKDRLVPLVIARMVGATGIGYITWSQNLAFLPLEFMNIITRITFPAFSRLQSDNELLSRAVEKSLFATAIVVYPALFGIGAILPSLVTYVVSSKWQPAVESFYLFAFSTYWAVMSTTFTNTLNAVGKIKITLKLMVMWTVLTWVLTPILTLSFGFIGVALASFIISFSSVVTIILVKRILVVSILEAISIPTLASFAMGLLVYIYSQFYVRDRLSLISAILIGAIFYSLIVYLFAKDKIVNDLKSLRRE